MYTEFILIFAGLGIIIVFLLVILILLIVLMKKSSNDLPSGAFMTAPTPPTPNSSSAPSYRQANPYQQAAPVSGQPSQGGSIVFCKNCYTQFDASVQFCPKCGSPRN